MLNVQSYWCNINVSAFVEINICLLVVFTQLFPPVPHCLHENAIWCQKGCHSLRCNVSSDSVMCVGFFFCNVRWGLKVSVEKSEQLKESVKLLTCHKSTPIYFLRQNRISRSRCRKNTSERSGAGTHAEDKDRRRWICGAVPLKPVNPESFPLFANAKPTKPELPGRKRLNYLRLRKVPDHSASYYFFRFRALGLCRTTSASHPQKKHDCQLEGEGGEGGRRSRWKMDDKYQDKWRLSQTVLSITKAEREPQISLFVLDCQTS